MNTFDIKRKKQLKRLDVNVMGRILMSIYESGSEKKTNIARNARLPYDKCSTYLDFLELIEFVKKNDKDKHKMYDVTANGILFCKKKLSLIEENESKKTHANILL